MTQVILTACIVNGKETSEAELKQLEAERTKVNLHSLKAHGVDLGLSDEEIDQLDDQAAWDLNLRARQGYSPSEWEAMYQEDSAKMEAMWKKVCNGFVLGKSPVVVAKTEMELHGVDADLIIHGESTGEAPADETLDEKMHRLAKEAAAISLRMHPEHFFVAASSTGLYGMETFGMYGAPYPQQIAALEPDQVPIDRDPAYPEVSTGQPHLMDGTPLYTIPFHQYQPLTDGIKMKLAVLMPAGTPEAIVSGHAYHLANEYLRTAMIYSQRRN